MRFEDWDVLLFPSGTPDQHVPLREYRVECHAVADERLSINGNSTKGSTVAPLMTAFVPSLERDAPFQVSVHSWMPKKFYFAPQPGTERVNHIQLWQIKIIVDGVTQCIETFRDDVKWPKVISIANMEPPINKKIPRPLHFPQFHEEVRTASSWDPEDPIGRVKVEISEGYAQVQPGKVINIGTVNFHKLLNHAVFNFQPAPFRVMQHSGIAYPNPDLEAQILPMKECHSNSLMALAGAVQMPRISDHSRNMSASSVSSYQYTSPYMGPGGPPNTPHFEEVPASAISWDLGHHFDENLSATSRSTSAYSNVPFSALPLPSTVANMPPPYPTATKRRADRPRADPSQVVLRLPSDQLRKILSALKQPPTVTASADSPKNTSMPPPPVPQHAIDRRNANASDVSMHAGCTNFPSCTTEDKDGHIFHQPAEVIRGRKEGTANTNGRDFFSSIPNILNPQTESSPVKVNSLLSSSPADGITKKRTRSTLKSLSMNEGSPEKLSKDREVSSPKPRKVSRAVFPEDDKENAPLDDTMSIDI